MKALIIGTDPTGHEVLVKTAFEAGGGVNSDIYEISAFNQTVIDYATSNGYDAIIYSYSGEDNYFAEARNNPGIMIFMPSDNYNGDLQQLVLTDLLPTTDDAEFTDDTQSAQSYSNGYICGQLFYIASQRGCSLQEARICANATKDEDGIIDVNSAIAYSDSVALTVGDIEAEQSDDLTISLTFDRVVDATSYVIKVTDLSGILVETIGTTSLTYDYTLPDYGVYLFSYKGINDNLESDYSDTAQEGQVRVIFFLIQEEDMAFGLAVSDYNIQTGTYGSSIKVDISTYQPYSIDWVQGEDESNIKSDTVTSPVSLSTLQNYFEDSACPDIAFSLNGEELTIFFKDGEYDTRFAFGGKRKAQALSNDTDLLDVPNELIDLLELYALDYAYLAIKHRSDEDILEKIQLAEYEVLN